MLIGEVAQQLDLNPKTIRYYEEIGLLPEPERTPAGYRAYTPEDVERIDFIRRGRVLDFSLDEIGEILRLRDHSEPPCPYVLGVLDRRTEQVKQKIEGLQRLQTELRGLHARASALSPELLAVKGRVCHIVENQAID